QGTILVSTDDGATWTPANSTTTNTLFGVAWLGTRYVAVGGSGTVLTSPNGTTWTQVAEGLVTAGLNAAAISNTGRIVVVGNSGAALTSDDGVTWTPAASGVSLYSIAW